MDDLDILAHEIVSLCFRKPDSEDRVRGMIEEAIEDRTILLQREAKKWRARANERQSQ